MGFGRVSQLGFEMQDFINLLLLCLLLSMRSILATKEMSNKHFRIAAYEWEPYVSLDKGAFMYNIHKGLGREGPKYAAGFCQTTNSIFNV